MYKISNKKMIGLISCFLFFSGLCTISNNVYSAEPLKKINDERLRILATELNPAIYLTDGRKTVYGQGAPVVVHADVVSLVSLYGQQNEFNTVELIEIRMKSPVDEQVKLDVSRLAAFTALKYILFTYEYDACGDGNDSCLDGKTSSIVTGSEGSSVTVLYLLSIPE